MTLDELAKFLGDAHRPFAIIATSAGATVATVIVAGRVDGFDGAALFIGAVFAGLTGLYWGRAWENRGESRAAAEVEIARATGRRSTDPQPVEVTNDPTRPVPVDPT